MAPLNKSLIAAALVLLLGSLGTWFLISKSAESQSEVAFVDAYSAFYKVKSEAYKASKAGLSERAYEISGTLEFSATGELGKVTTISMALKPELKKLALDWTEAEGEAVRAEASHWKALGDQSFALEQRDFSERDKLLAEIDKWESKAREAEAKAGHIWDQLDGLLSESAKAHLKELSGKFKP